MATRRFANWPPLPSFCYDARAVEYRTTLLRIVVLKGTPAFSGTTEI
jgi:hypothetical protein